MILRIDLYLIVLGLCCLSVAQSGTTNPSTPKQSEITQNGSVIHLVVSGPRPLADAVDALQKKYGWNINYEDPQFVAKSDLVESADGRYINPVTGAKPHLPNGASFSVDFSAGAGTTPDPAATLKTVVEAYNKSSNPGQFELRVREGYFDVVGIAARDDSGKIQRQSPPLDTVVTMSAQEMPAKDIVNSICEQISKLTGQSINVGVYPRSLLGQTITPAAAKLPARDAISKVLSQTLSGTSKTVHWHLLYDPDTKGYFLNLLMAH